MTINCKTSNYYTVNVKKNVSKVGLSASIMLINNAEQKWMKLINEVDDWKKQHRQFLIPFNFVDQSSWNSCTVKCKQIVYQRTISYETLWRQVEVESVYRNQICFKLLIFIEGFKYFIISSTSLFKTLLICMDFIHVHAMKGLLHYYHFKTMRETPIHLRNTNSTRSARISLVISYFITFINAILNWSISITFMEHRK